MAAHGGSHGSAHGSAHGRFNNIAAHGANNVHDAHDGSSWLNGTSQLRYFYQLSIFFTHRQYVASYS